MNRSVAVASGASRHKSPDALVYVSLYMRGCMCARVALYDSANACVYMRICTLVQAFMSVRRCVRVCAHMCVYMYVYIV